MWTCRRERSCWSQRWLGRITSPEPRHIYKACGLLTFCFSFRSFPVLSFSFLFCSFLFCSFSFFFSFLSFFSLSLSLSLSYVAHNTKTSSKRQNRTWQKKKVHTFWTWTCVPDINGHMWILQPQKASKLHRNGCSRYTSLTARSEDPRVLKENKQNPLRYHPTSQVHHLPPTQNSIQSGVGDLPMPAASTPRPLLEVDSRYDTALSEYEQVFLRVRLT